MLKIITVNLREANYCDAGLTSLLTIRQCKMFCKYKTLSEENAAHVQLHNAGNCQFNTNILPGITANREKKYPVRDKFS